MNEKIWSLNKILKNVEKKNQEKKTFGIQQSVDVSTSPAPPPAPATTPNCSPSSCGSNATSCSFISLSEALTTATTTIPVPQRRHNGNTVGVVDFGGGSLPSSSASSSSTVSSCSRDSLEDLSLHHHVTTLTTLYPLTAAAAAASQVSKSSDFPFWTDILFFFIFDFLKKFLSFLHVLCFFSPAICYNWTNCWYNCKEVCIIVIIGNWMSVCTVFSIYFEISEFNSELIRCVKRYISIVLFSIFLWLVQAYFFFKESQLSCFEFQWNVLYSS